MSVKQLHKQWRKEFNNSVFTRDNHKCRKCGYTENLDAHHITDRHDLPNGGYVESNGISLCEKCHIKAGEHHITNGKSWPEGFHPNDLYQMIGSSYEKAFEDSNNLMPC
jgi:5-methylcytosine-specific restriction endonuclease McrA